MKVYVTHKDVITAKKSGVTYVKLSYIRDNGETGEVFTTEEKYTAFKVDESIFLTAESVKQLLSSADPISVEYDAKGFVVGIG